MESKTPSKCLENDAKALHVDVTHGTEPASPRDISTTANNFKLPLSSTCYPSEGLNRAEMTPMISSVESTVIHAEDTAKLLSDQSSVIVPRLEDGFAQLGYGGKYPIQFGFNEEFLEEKLHPEVFVFLDTELKCDEAAISKVISPIFSPYTTIVYTPSQVYYLDPPTEAFGVPNSKGSSSSSVTLHQLSGNPLRDSQPSGHAGQATGQGQESGQGTNCDSFNKEQNQKPDKEEDDAASDEEQQPVKGGNVKPNEEEPENDDRHLEFDLCAVLRLKDEDGQASDVVISRIETLFKVEVHSNKDGNEPPHLRTSRTVQDPWAFIEICDLDISTETSRYALSAIEAQIVTTQAKARCLQRHPEPEGRTGSHKAHAEHQEGMIMRRGAEPQPWDPISTTCPDTIKNIRSVRLGYRSNRPGRMTDKQSFKSTLHTILTSPPHPAGTDWILNIELKAFWKSTERPDMTTNVLSRLGVRPNDLVDFYHKVFFKINLGKMLRGKVTKWVGEITPIEDFIQGRWGSDESALGSVEVEFLPRDKQTTSETSSGPDHRFAMTVHRTVVEAVKSKNSVSGFKEGDRATSEESV